MKIRTLLAAAILALPTVSAKAGMMETLPVGDEVYRWTYEYLDELYTRGLLHDLHLGTKPFFRGEIAQELLSLRERIARGEITISWPEDFLLQELEDEFAGEMNQLRLKADSPEEARIDREFSWGLDFREGSSFKSREKAAFRETLWPYAKARIGQSFFACTRYMIDENLAKDPDYQGKIWRGFAGDAAQAYLSFELPYLKVLLGRERVAWGQRSTGELILSQNALPLDMVKIQGGWGIVQGSAFVAFLSSLTVRDSVGEISHLNRYLSGHRISLNLFSKAQLGFSETIIYGGEDRQVEAYYLNPLLWYHGAQLNENRDDNTFFALDFNLRPKRDVILYGELLIDDLQIEKKQPGDQEPNELGYTGGFSVMDVFGWRGSEVNFEYTRINNWTYNQSLKRNRYLHRNRLLGNPLGPDADDLTASVSTWWRGGLKSKITYQRTRCGEGGVDSPWNEPWLSTGWDYLVAFPRGVVERLSRVGVALEYNYAGVLGCRLNWDHLDFDNYRNVEDRKESLEEFGLNLSYRFQGPLY